MQKIASFYDNQNGDKVTCRLCPHECLIPESGFGICQVRQNRKGILYSENYGMVAALHSDPIEKKPLYHFFPGRNILSAGTLGCNLRCHFCQNYSLSRADIRKSFEAMKPMSTDELLDHVERTPGNIGISYTYNEPAIWFEYVLDASKKLQKAGKKNVMISNGFINPAPLEKLLQYIDAFNIDLKSFSDKFYREVTHSRLAPVLETIKKIGQSDRHLELTHLVIPGLNDNPDEFREMVDWIAHEIGSEVPLHISRYFPAYLMDNEPTPIDTLETFYRLAREKLHYVFLGNVSGLADRSNTSCPACGKVVIQRQGYRITGSFLNEQGQCSNCNTAIAIVNQELS